MSIKKFSVSKNDNVYEAWPDVVLTHNNKLICVFSECKHHVDRGETNIVIKQSSDRGRNWGEKTKIAGAAVDDDYYWNCARISRLSDMSLVIVADKIYKDNGDETGHTGNCLWFADAEGHSWDGPYETPITGIVPDKLKELKCGRWIISTHEKSDKTGFLKQSMWYSDDKGGNWIGPVTVAQKEGLNLCEATILELPDETLIAYMRENSFIGLDCFKSISKDNGQTWEGVYNVPIPGCHRPVSGMLISGRIFITYRFFQGGERTWGGRMQNFFSALTDINSAKQTERSKQTARIMPIDYDRSPVADLGYSGWVQFDDGEIYIVGYIVDDSPNGQIRGYSLHESDFILE